MTTFFMFFDLSQANARRIIDTVNENYYRQIMDRVTDQGIEINRLGVKESAAPARIASRMLLGERKELVIVHNGREYRLRQTQNGKLILTA